MSDLADIWKPAAGGKALIDKGGELKVFYATSKNACTWFLLCELYITRKAGFAAYILDS
jgi:hypothetical protein